MPSEEPSAGATGSGLAPPKSNARYIEEKYIVQYECIPWYLEEDYWCYEHKPEWPNEFNLGVYLGI